MLAALDFALARPLSIKSTRKSDFHAKGSGVQTILAEGFEGKSISGSLARSLSIKATFWKLKLSSGSTPVDKSNVFGCAEGFKREALELIWELPSTNQMNPMRK